MTPAGHRVRRAFSRAAASYDGAAEVQRAVLADLIARLPPVSATTVTDVGCGTGFALAGLRQRFPAARLIGIDFAAAMLAHVPAADGVQKICANATLLPLADASTDLLVSSLTYQWCDLDRALGEAFRVLRPGGWLAFSTLTGDTFRELRAAFAGLDHAPHVLPLLAPEAISAAVAAAGFAAPATGRAIYVPRFADPRALFDSIRRTGASEVEATGSGAGRRRGLLGKAGYALILHRLQTNTDAAGHLPLTYEVMTVIARKPGASS